MKVKVLLSNRVAQFIQPYPREQFQELFGYLSPSAFYSPLYHKRDSEGNRLWNGIKSFLKYDRVPSGLFISLKDKIEEEWDVKFKIEYDRKKPQFEDLDLDDISDRVYQNECIEAMRKASKLGGLVISATGTGKTYIAGKYFQSLVGNGVFIVDELALLSQAQKELSEVMGERVGYIGNMKFKPRRITVATAQTLHLHRNDPKFKPWMKSIQVTIIDEVHAMLGRRNFEIVAAIQPRACFGLTATLRYKQKKVRMQATALTGPIIYKFPLKQGVKEKVLTPGIVVGVNVTKAGHKHFEYWEEYDRLIAASKRFNTIIEKIVRAAHKRDKYVMQMVHRPKHVRILSKRLNDVPHGIASGQVKVVDRLQAKYDFDKKRTRLIIANQVFKKGTNIRRVDLMVDAAMLSNYNDAQQKYGRGVRLCDDKQGLIYIDIGFRNPKHVTKHDFSFNRFAKGTRVRRKALRDLGLPIFEIDWRDSGNDVVRFAIRKLKRFLRKQNV